MADVLFYLGLSILFAHELDAVVQREWRVLFGLRRLPEQTAAPLFVLSHIPLLTVILLFTTDGSDYVRFTSRTVLDVFFVIHAYLHWHLRSNPAHTFDSRFSRSLIGGAAVVGAAHLFLTVWLQWQ